MTSHTSENKVPRWLAGLQTSWLVLHICSSYHHRTWNTA